MTIGPDPITSTDSMSSRRPISYALASNNGSFGHQPPEVLEQVPGVVGAGSGLGVILDAERRLIETAQALDHSVVQVYVGHLDRGTHVVRGHGVVVVLAGDLDRTAV